MDFLILGVFMILANKEPYRMHSIMYLIVIFYYTVSSLVKVLFHNLVISEDFWESQNLVFLLCKVFLWLCYEDVLGLDLSFLAQALLHSTTESFLLFVVQFLSRSCFVEVAFFLIGSQDVLRQLMLVKESLFLFMLFLLKQFFIQL